MKIALFGATGTIGTRIAREAISRGHHVTALSRRGTDSGIEGVEYRGIDRVVHTPAFIGR